MYSYQENGYENMYVINITKTKKVFKKKIFENLQK